MIEQEYFTPKIEDLFIGYECEWYGQSTRKLVKVTRWQPFKIISSNNISPTVVKNLRTPYLSKEQIENEGWTLQEEFPYVHSIGFIKNVTYRETNHTVFLYYNYSSKWLLITIQSVIDNIYSIKYTTEKTDININGNTLYAGTCLDINTFRYICKLLGI